MSDDPQFFIRPASDLVCVCGDPVQWMDASDGGGWIHSPGSDTPCLDARPRCPHCRLPHDLTPGSWIVAVCRTARAFSEQSRTTPDNPVSSGDTADNLTPGCDCGHDGMAFEWHANDCAWKVDTEFALPAHPSLFLDPPTPRRAAPPDVTVAASRNAPDLRARLVSALEECRTLIPEVQADAVLAVVDAALPDRAQAAIRALEQQRDAREERLERVREYVRTTDDDGVRTREQVLRILGVARGEVGQ